MKFLKNREGFKQALRGYLKTLGVIPASEIETCSEDIVVIAEQHVTNEELRK